MREKKRMIFNLKFVYNFIKLNVLKKIRNKK